MHFMRVVWDGWGRKAWPGKDDGGNQSVKGFEIGYETEKHQRCGQTRGHGAVLGMARTVKVSLGESKSLRRSRYREAAWIFVWSSVDT